MKESNEKKKVKGTKRKIAARVLAAIMVVLMLLAACSTCIFYVIYNA